MHLGVISDILADYEALKLAMELLVVFRVNKIVFPGDVVEKQPNGDAWQICSEMGLLPMYVAIMVNRHRLISIKLTMIRMTAIEQFIH